MSLAANAPWVVLCHLNRCIRERSPVASDQEQHHSVRNPSRIFRSIFWQVL